MKRTLALLIVLLMLSAFGCGPVPEDRSAEGEGIVTKWDDLTYAEDDMVKVVARQYAGYGVTAPGRLVKLCKPAGGETT